jgi:hypothetical protein
MWKPVHLTHGKRTHFFELKRWAKQFISTHRQLVVYVGRQRILVLPDREVDLGLVADDEIILTKQRQISNGIELNVMKEKRIPHS